MDEATGQPSNATTTPGGSEFNQADIDAVLAEAAGGVVAATEPPAPLNQAVPPPTDEIGFSQADIDALMGSAGGADAGQAVEVAMPPPAKEVAPAPPRAAPAAAVAAYPLPDWSPTPAPQVDPKRVSMLADVNLRVKVQLGRTRMLVEDILKLGEGSVVELDKLAGDPVDVLVNERLIARGEVLVLNDNFCVRISEVFSNNPHRVTT